MVREGPFVPCPRSLLYFYHGAADCPPYCVYRPCDGVHFCLEVDGSAAEVVGIHLDGNMGQCSRGGDEIPLVVGRLGCTAVESMAAGNPTSVCARDVVPAEMTPLSIL